MTQNTEKEDRKEVENRLQMEHLLAIVFLSVEQMQTVIVCVLVDSLIDSTSSGKPKMNIV